MSPFVTGMWMHRLYASLRTSFFQFPNFLFRPPLFARSKGKEKARSIGINDYLVWCPTGCPFLNFWQPSGQLDKSNQNQSESYSFITELSRLPHYYFFSKSVWSRPKNGREKIFVFENSFLVQFVESNIWANIIGRIFCGGENQLKENNFSFLSGSNTNPSQPMS